MRLRRRSWNRKIEMRKEGVKAVLESGKAGPQQMLLDF